MKHPSCEISDGIASLINSIESEYGLGRDPSHSASNETFCRCHNRGRICYCDTRQGSDNAELKRSDNSYDEIEEGKEISNYHL